MSAAPVLELRGVTKYYGEREVLAGIELTVAEGEAVAVIGSSGSGKSTLLRCIDLLEEIDDGDIYLDGVAGHRSGHQPGPGPPPPRPRVPGLQPVPAQVGDRERRRSARCWRSGWRAREARRRRPRAARALRPRRPRARLPGPPVGRPAAARRDRAGADDAPARAAARRGHERARSRARRRGPRDHPRAQARRHDDADRDARDGVRARRSPTRSATWRRADRRARPPEQIFSDPAQPSTRRFLARLLERA